MKRLERTDVGIEYVKLLADHSKRKGSHSYSEDAIKAFGDEVGESLAASAQAEHRLRGLRVEALFMCVVASLGKVALIKEEDAGECYYAGDDVSPPDYRIVLNDGTQLLVEVKAHRLEKSFEKVYKISHARIERLRRYAELTKTELRFAIFWEEMSTWTLNRLDAFDAGASGKKWSIGYGRAIMTNEMRSLGDKIIQTIAPLRVRILFDPEKSEPVPEGGGRHTVCIDGLRLLSHETPLDGRSAKIAWKLLWYGGWSEVEENAHQEGDRLLWVEYTYAPTGWDEPESQMEQGGPAFVGQISGMISRGYLDGAKGTVHSSATGDVLQPGYMSNFIPEDWDFKAEALRLWIFEQEPNFKKENEEEGESLA